MQISIIVVIDIETALKQNSLEGNTYLFDNTKVFAPQAVDDVALMTYAPGSNKPNGAQASETVLNWIFVGVAGLPPTLPRNFRQIFGPEGRDQKLLRTLKSTRNQGAISKLLSEFESSKAHAALVRQPDGDTGISKNPIVNTIGEIVSQPNLVTAANIPPVVKSISGPAVEQGVMYPALYGSPDVYFEGWYWSASIDTGKQGIHEYKMDVVLHSPVLENDRTVWEPRHFTMTAAVDVSSSTVRNGFNNCFGPGLLPIYCGDTL